MKVSTIQYAKTLLDLTENKSQEEILDMTTKFAELLKSEGQLKNSAKIIEKFSELYNSAHGIIDAEVVTGRKLEEVQMVKLQNFIKEKYGANEVVVKNIIDEEIKGGIVIRVGDEVIDGSVSSQLKRLKDILSK